MKKKVWTNADQNRALKEGWAIFNDNEIQRDDETEKFPSDDDALSFVMNKAKGGSRFHRRALAIHKPRPKRRRFFIVLDVTAEDHTKENIALWIETAMAKGGGDPDPTVYTYVGDIVKDMEDGTGPFKA